MEKINNRVKTTLLIDKTLKKLAQLYAIQNDKTLQAVVEDALRQFLLKNEETENSPLVDNTVN